METTRRWKQRRYQHGLSLMKQTVTKYGYRAIDGRSRLAYSIKAWRKEVATSLGGEDAITPQQRTIIEMASMNRMIVSSIDAWIAERTNLVTHGNTLLPVIVQRQQLVNGLVHMLTTLGLERRSKEVSLQDYVNEKYGSKDNKDEESES